MSRLTSIFASHQGLPMSTKVSAKRVAALEVCKRLHQIGELNKSLLPITESEDPENFDYLFTHWITEKDSEAEPTSAEKQTTQENPQEDKLKVAKPKPGTKKFIRQHKIHVTFIHSFSVTTSLNK